MPNLVLLPKDVRGVCVLGVVVGGDFPEMGGGGNEIGERELSNPTYSDSN